METESNMINSDEFERSLGFLIHDIARKMRLDFQRRVRSSGLTPAQWFVLACGAVWAVSSRMPGEADLDDENISRMITRTLHNRQFGVWDDDGREIG